MSIFFVGCENIYRNNCLNLYWNIFIHICCRYIEGKYLYEKLSYCNSILCDNYNNSVCTTSPLYFLKWINAFGGETFVVNNDETMMYSQEAIEEEVETQECKSPCPSSAKMCIEMCA